MAWRRKKPGTQQSRCCPISPGTFRVEHRLVIEAFLNWRCLIHRTVAAIHITVFASILHYDDIIQWKHFSALRAFVWGIHRSPVDSPHKGQWRGALMFLLLYKRLSKQSRRRCFETQSRPLRRHCHGNGNVFILMKLPSLAAMISIGSGKGLAPNRRQAIFPTNADLLSIRTLRNKLMLPAQ